MKELKVGDWVVIQQGTGNFHESMKAYIGKCVQITDIEDFADTYKRIKFIDSSVWTWESLHNHFRPALPNEIPGRTIISKEQKEHLLNLISSI